MIIVDTSVLIEALGAGGGLRTEFRRLLSQGHRMSVPTWVLYEWLRGPRLPTEIEMQEAILPSKNAIPFGPNEARTAASLYRALPRARSREVDFAIAACVLTWGGRLWTLNRVDFADVPELELFEPS